MSENTSQIGTEKDMSISLDTENSKIRQKVAERIKQASRFTLPYAHFAKNAETRLF